MEGIGSGGDGGNMFYSPENYFSAGDPSYISNVQDEQPNPDSSSPQLGETPQNWGSSTAESDLESDPDELSNEPSNEPSKDPVETKEEPDLEWILDHLPPNLLGDRAQSRKIRLAYLSNLFEKRMTMQGSDRTKVCTVCFHPGHDSQSDPSDCPVARLSSHLEKVQQPHKAGFPPVLETPDGFFFDLLLVGRGYEWGIETLKDGDGGSFGITIASVKAIEHILQVAETVRHSKGYTLKNLGYPELGGDLRFDGARTADLMDGLPDGVKELPISRPPAHLKVPCSLPIRGTQTRSSKKPSFKRKGKNVKLWEIHELPVTGDRLGNTCTKCFLRGHVWSSHKICPLGILGDALKKSESKRQWKHNMDKYINAAETLRRVVWVCDQIGAAQADDIKPFLAQWEELYESISGAGEDLTTKAKRKRARTMEPPKITLPADILEAMELDPQTCGFGKEEYSFLDNVSENDPNTTVIIRGGLLRTLGFALQGARADTFCRACGFCGHDLRARICFVNHIRQAIETGNFVKNYADLKNKITCLRDVMAWYCGIPPQFKESQRDFTVVVDLFEAVRAMVDYQQLEQQPEYQSEYQPEYQPNYKPDYQSGYQPDYDPDYKPDYQPESECQSEYQPEFQPEYQPELQQPARKRVRSASLDKKKGSSGSFITLDERKMNGDILKKVVPYMVLSEIPRGIAVDHTKFPQGLFMEIVEYII